MSRNDFAENFHFGVRKHRRLLDIFYKHYCYDARFVCLEDSAKSPFSTRLQREFKTDTVIQKGVYESYGVEEKVVGWPETDRAYTAFFLETHSCTNPGHESAGWMTTCQADLLLYAFEVKAVGLVIYLLDFPCLQAWFEQSYLPHLTPGDAGVFVMADENRTQGRIVAINQVVNAVPTRCFLVTFQEHFSTLKSTVDLHQLREHFLRGAQRNQHGQESHTG